MIVYVYIRVVGQLYINVGVEAPIYISRKRLTSIKKDEGRNIPDNSEVLVRSSECYNEELGVDPVPAVHPVHVGGLVSFQL